MSHTNSNIPTNITEGIPHTPTPSSHEVTIVIENLTEALNHSVEQCELYADHAALFSAASHALGPIYNATLTQYEKTTAYIATLYSLAEHQLALIAACEKHLVNFMLVGICHPDRRRLLFEEFERGKVKWDVLMDWLEELRLEIREGEGVLRRVKVELEDCKGQLNEWEEQRRGAVWEGEGFLDEAGALWEERNFWLVQNGLAPVEGGLEAFGV